MKLSWYQQGIISILKTDHIALETGGLTIIQFILLLFKVKGLKTPCGIKGCVRMEAFSFVLLLFIHLSVSVSRKTCAP